MRLWPSMPNVRQELSYDVLALLCFLISLCLGKLEFYFVTMTFPSESRRGVILAPNQEFQQR